MKCVLGTYTACVCACVCVCVRVHNTLRCATDLNSPPPTFNQALGVWRLVFLTSQDESKESQ